MGEKNSTKMAPEHAEEPQAPPLVQMLPAPSGLWLFGYVPTPDVGPALLALPVVAYMFFSNGVMRPVAARIVHNFIELAVVNENELEPGMQRALFEHRWTRKQMEQMAFEDHWRRQEELNKIVVAN